MTTRREYDLLNRLRRVESIATATNTPGTVFDSQCDQASRPPNVESKSGFSTGSKRKLEFEYDWRGRRINQVSHSDWNGSSYPSSITTKFIDNGWNLMAELERSNNVILSYVWGADLSATMKGAGEVGRRLEFQFPPPDSPELNPEDLVWQDLETNGVGRKPVESTKELHERVTAYMKTLKGQHRKVRLFFKPAHTKYTAI